MHIITGGNRLLSRIITIHFSHFKRTLFFYNYAVLLPAHRYTLYLWLIHSSLFHLK